MLRCGIVAFLVVFAVGSCSGGSPSVPRSGLTLTRDGADAYEFHDADAKCIKSEAGTGDTEVVRLTTPANYKRAFHKGRLLKPFLYVEVIPGVEGRRNLPLKGRNYDEGPPDVTIFGADPESQNEVSGATEVATGRVSIIEASCDPEPRVAFTIRATLGSEYGNGRSVHVVGGLEAHGRTTE